MATQESNNPPPNPPLPEYPELIMAAIEALNDKNGVNKSAISKYIESSYGDLPAAHSTLLTHHLNKMKQGGQLIVLKNNYLKPDPNAPRRGRGRPPKPKEPLPPGTVLSPPRPRGRPPKPKDAFAAPTPSKKAGSGKPRGRPPKKAKVASAAPVKTGPPRPRGRPPKVKPAVAAVGC